MNYFKIIITSFLFFFSIFAHTQSSVITVLDQSKESIPFAHIHLLDSDKYILTDFDGKAEINFDSKKSLLIELTCIGFVKQKQEVFPNKDLVIIMEKDVVTINTVVITGQYSESNPEKAVQKITIIDAEKIEKMAAVNLRDVLSNEMNVRLSQDNILGSGMSLQGMSGENVKILIDGVPVVGRLNGNVDLSQINLNDIERIEIIEGPMSVNYGTNALAGVINLITKTNTKKKMSLTINSYYENIGQFNVDATAAFSVKKHSFSLSGGRNYFDGWIDGDNTFGEEVRIADTTRYKSWKPKEQYFGKFHYNYKIKDGNIKYSLGYFDEKITNRGLPRAPYQESAFDDYYYTTRIDNALFFTKDLKNNKHIKTTFAYNDYQRIKNTFIRDLTSIEDVQTANEGDQDTTKFNQFTVRGSYSTSMKAKKLNYEIGVDLNLEEAFGRRIENETQLMGDYALYVSGEYKPFPNTIIRPGVRYAYNTIYKAPITPSVNVKQTYKKFNFRGSYARGFRAPSLKELYFDFVDINHNIVGNTELKAEQSHNFNFSANYTKLIKSYLLKMELSSFYNKIDNLITLAQQGEGVAFSYVNIGDYQTHGFQLNNNISYNHFKFGIGASYIGRYNYLSEENDIDKYSYTPEFKSTVNYDFHKAKMFVSLFYKYTGKLPRYRTVGDEISQTHVEAYNIADVSVGKKMWKKRFHLVVGSKNLFNVKNVNSVTSGSAHSGSGGSSPVAMGRTYFVKMTFKIHHDKKK